MKNYIGFIPIVAKEQEKDGMKGYAVQMMNGGTEWFSKDFFESIHIAQGEDPSRITEQMVDDFIVSHESCRLGNHAVVLVKLRNGFELIESSACVNPANYSQEIGDAYALEKAKKKVWELLGFLLATARNGVNNA